MSIVKLKNALFSKLGAGKTAVEIFPKPTTLSISPTERLGIIGTHKTEMLEVLAGQHVAHPSSSRSYSGWPFTVELLRFSGKDYGKSADGRGNGGFTHLSARYEFFKDFEVDELTSDFVANKSYNSSKPLNKELFHRLIKSLHLQGLEDTYINGLSNGQFRRARLARALYKQPRLLLVDEPFLGLDPTATETVSNVLSQDYTGTSIVLGLRVQDEVPEWIDRLALMNKEGLMFEGPKDQASGKLVELIEQHHATQERIEQNKMENLKRFNQRQQENVNRDRCVIDFDHVNLSYSGKQVIKDLNWKVFDGEKWHIRGNNGTGKTTILALITLDHPKAWNKSIKMFGEERSTGKTNYFDNNAQIGFSSPELHSIFPQHLSVYSAIATGFVTCGFIPPNELSADSKSKIEAILKVLDLTDRAEVKLGDLDVSDQKLVLFARAVVKQPKLLILDEALSAMSEENIFKTKAFLESWNKGAVLCIGHVDHEVPHCDKYLRLVDPADGKYEVEVCE